MISEAMYCDSCNDTLGFNEGDPDDTGRPLFCDDRCAAQYKRDHPEESNSSAPLTGWTRDWPTEPGWWWVHTAQKDFDWIDPMQARMFCGSLIHVWLGERMTTESHPNAMFHPMAQPPEPPKDI